MPLQDSVLRQVGELTSEIHFTREGKQYSWTLRLSCFKGHEDALVEKLERLDKLMQEKFNSKRDE